MKKIAILTFCLLTGVAIGQPQDLQERIESMRVAFITNKLQLTPEQSQQFWPVFNQFRDELEALRKEYRMPRSLETMSDAEAEAYLNATMEREELELQLKKEYIEKLRDVISVRQILLLKKAEDDFKRKLLGLRQQQGKQQKRGIHRQK